MSVPIPKSITFLIPGLSLIWCGCLPLTLNTVHRKWKDWSLCSEYKTNSQLFIVEVFAFLFYWWTTICRCDKPNLIESFKMLYSLSILSWLETKTEPFLAVNFSVMTCLISRKGQNYSTLFFFLVQTNKANMHNSKWVLVLFSALRLCLQCKLSGKRRNVYKKESPQKPE